ncbi:hypothetical protein [Ohtaekwangia koreensis]|uniref:Uncharacterized protein n=1 Tax=Ohtaekwangia koreensis TaxID=688867 RepID=A0A1T5LQI1_9BACT|nr:hypothetical protein [Ohtaekwangia koreensis]SKC78257.1 hypothetical protein SAMN05660236_3712 [Ohtaekwangia koreensis]
MKAILKLSAISLVLLLGACGQKSHDHEGHDHDHHAHDSANASPDDALYTEVMKIHDEVMPKMGDIYTLKESLQKKLDTPGTEAGKKKEIEGAIVKLDAADDAMRVWMREFNTKLDSVKLEGEEKTQEYLKNEMERIKKVKEDMLSAIEQAKSL